MFLNTPEQSPVDALSRDGCALIAAPQLKQRLAGAADAAALAAADAASGAVAGEACELAEAIAAASNARLATCAIDSATVTVTVSAPFGQLVAAASARAGPPP